MSIVAEDIEAKPVSAGKVDTLADLLRRLGDIPPERVLLCPAPGTATEEDLFEAERRGHLCELVDGTLVEKATGYEESSLALTLGYFLVDFVRRHRLGITAGSDGTLRLFPGLVRIPDISFVSWARLPGRDEHKKPIPSLAPDLAVEVLSKSNSRAEMTRKLGEYFEAGVRLVWMVDPRVGTVRVHTGPEVSTLLSVGDTLDGGDVLPGFELPLATLFEPELPPE